MEIRNLVLKTAGLSVAAILLLSAAAAEAKTRPETGQAFGQWQALGSGYVARRKVPPKAELPVAQPQAAKSQAGGALAVAARSNSTVLAPVAVTTFQALWLRTGVAGLYGVSVADLAAGLGVNATTLRTNAGKGALSLTNAGAKTSWYFDSTADVILFAAAPYDTFYTNKNAFYFKPDKSSAAPMTVSKTKATTAAGIKTPFKDTLKFEEEPDFYFSLWTVAKEPDADYWFWDYLYGGYKDLIEVPLVIPDPAPAGTAQIRVTLRGWTDMEAGKEHHVKAELNGIAVGSELTWDAFDQAVLVANFNQSLLSPSGNNTLSLRNSYTTGEHPGQWLDAVEVDYSRLPVAHEGALWMRKLAKGAQKVTGLTSNNVLLVESPAGAAILRKDARIEPDGAGGWAIIFDAVAGKDYLVAEAGALEVPELTATNSAKLTDTANRANYLIIAPREFAGTAAALAALKGGQFSYVKIVWLDDIYSEFSFGRVDPYAIGLFMKQAMKWSTKPSNVVIVGKGSIDEKNRMGYSDSFVPVIMTDTPWSLAASDERLLAGAGAASFAIGRLPIINDAEGLAYVDKLVDYETAVPGDERFRAVLAADNPDDAGDFPANSDLFADLLVNSLGFTSVTKLYHPVDAVRAGLTDSATWESGYVSYDGHGSTSQVGDYIENFINTDDAGLLFNSVYPIFVALTCAAGDDSLPGTRSLAGALVLNPAGGAIASLSPTGLSLDADAHELGLAFVDSLFGNSNTVGNAVRDAKSATAGSIPSFMPRIYSVVGEPAVYAQ